MRRKMKEIKSYLNLKGKERYEGSKTSRVIYKEGKDEKAEEVVAESKQVDLDNAKKSSDSLKK